MPLYAYHCDTCDAEFEVQQSFSDNPIDRCPQCAGSEVRRLIMPVGVIFKGSGFYVTDNRKSGSGSRSSNGKESTKQSDKSSESKSETSESKTS